MRQSGVILHISSLPSAYGIGTMGAEARRFVDFMAEAGLRYWQILPLGEINQSNSPYQSPCVFAGNPLFIDLEQLCAEGLLNREELDETYWGSDPRRVDFPAVKAGRDRLLRLAWQRCGSRLDPQLEQFSRDNGYWLPDYLRFMTMQELGGVLDPVLRQGLAQRKPEALVKFDKEYAPFQRYYLFLQYVFFNQWKQLRAYANSHGISFIGDIPIYVAASSADVWAHPELFRLDAEGKMTGQAGCPPDAFSEDGQMWGNPLYNWDEMAKQNFRWWAERLKQCHQLCDKVRLDHFRGFEAYFNIPFNAQKATEGHWEEGPGIAFFDAMKAQVRGLDLIAEDLGTLSEGVHKLREAAGCPGMAVLQFAFDGNNANSYLPHNMTRDRIMYAGTHDNDTLAGWYRSLPDWQRAYCGYYARPGWEKPWWDMLGTAWSTVCDLAMAQMQDFLGLDSSCRMNLPGSPENNWVWRMLPYEANYDLARAILELNRLYGRDN